MQRPPPKKSRGLLAFFLGCSSVLALGCVGACAFFAFFADEEEQPDVAPQITGPIVAPDARSALLGTYVGTYDASGSVAGIAAQEYHDRGTITVSAGQGSDLVFTSVTRQTGDTCTVEASWDGEVARVRPGQQCEGEFNDGTTYTGTIATGIARLNGDQLTIETSGRIWGRRGFIPYAGNYTGEWRCTRQR